MAEQRDRLVAELILATRQMNRQVVRYYDAVADQLGLPVTDLACVGVLRDQRRATAGQLAAELGLTTGAVSRMVDRLHRAGLVRRLRDPRDRRRVIVELVTEAETAVAGIFASQAAQITEATSDLDDAHLRLVLRYVRERADASRREADRLRREGRPHATRGARLYAPR